MNHCLPDWLRTVRAKRPALRELRPALDRLGVNTVCESARCPNIGECWASRAATFMILGTTCTRNCRFCAVNHGCVQPPDPAEPQRIAAAAKEFGLRHVVVTSVTRDDLPDGGAAHFAATITAVKSALDVSVEVLVPDFKGQRGSVATVLAARPHIFGHNVETVPRLYGTVRPGASYERSLAVLRIAKDISPSQQTKSGLMAGLGERPPEVEDVLRDLKAAGVDMVTIGQYLRPSADQLPVAEYVSPEQFEEYERTARELGFRGVLCGPLVRSSYHAEQMACEG